MSGEMTFDLVRELLGRMDGAEARFQAGRGLHESRVICREDAQDRFARQAIPLARLALSALARAEAAEAERARLRAAVADALWEHVIYDAPRRAKPHLLKVMSIDELHAHMEARPAAAEAGGGEG